MRGFFKRKIEPDGHASISVTMNVYNNVTDWERIVREISKLDEAQVIYIKEIHHAE